MIEKESTLIMTYGHGTHLLDDIEAAAEVLGEDMSTERAARLAAEREAEAGAVIERAAAAYRANIGGHLGLGITPEPVWLGFPAGDPDGALEDEWREHGGLLPRTAGALADLGDGVWLEYMDGRNGTFSMRVMARCIECDGMRYLDASTLDRIGPAIVELRQGAACRGECWGSETAPTWQSANRRAACRLAEVPDRPGRLTQRAAAWAMDLLAADRVLECAVTGLSVAVAGNRAHVAVHVELDERADGIRPAARVASLLGLPELPEVPTNEEIQTDQDGNRWIDHAFMRELSTEHGSVSVTVSGRERF
jgi:hypothetical protein